jgi:HlyD family secretion protein
VKLENLALRGLPEKFRPIPGMTLSAEIKAGQRSILSYFLYPLTRAFDEGLREP